MGDTPEGAVVFLLPDGSEVSNDPRYEYQKMLEQVVSAQENMGRATLSMQEYHEQLGTGQPGTVFTGQDAAMSQPPVRMQMVEAPQQEDQSGTSPENLDPADSDETDYGNWSAQQLKDEVRARKASGRELDTSNVTKKSQLVRLLEADDEAVGNAPADGSYKPTK